MEVRTTPRFRKWLQEVPDRRARARIQTRIVRIGLGNLGDVKSVGDGIGELRVDYGPGYRVYFVRRGDTLVILLCGGDKRTQASDIALAKVIAKEVR